MRARGGTPSLRGHTAPWVPYDRWRRKFHRQRTRILDPRVLGMIAPVVGAGTGVDTHLTSREPLDRSAYLLGWLDFTGPIHPQEVEPDARLASGPSDGERLWIPGEGGLMPDP